MYNFVTSAADVTYAGGTEATYQIMPTANFGFTVEEPEMWCKVKLSAFISLSAAGKAYLNLKVDDAFLVGTATTLGLAATTLDAAEPNLRSWVVAERTVRLSQGFHTINGWVRSSANGITVTSSGTLVPMMLEVTRLSNNNVLAHGVDSKQASNVTQ